MFHTIVVFRVPIDNPNLFLVLEAHLSSDGLKAVDGSVIIIHHSYET